MMTPKLEAALERVAEAATEAMRGAVFNDDCVKISREHAQELNAALHALLATKCTAFAG